MKKVISSFLCLALVFCMSASAFAAADRVDNEVTPNALITWYITTDGVHLRASENGTSLGLVYAGDTFTNGGVSDVITNGVEWRKCTMTSGQNNGKTGYVAKAYTAWKLF